MMHVKNGPDCTCPNDEFHDRIDLEALGRLTAVSLSDDAGTKEQLTNARTHLQVRSAQNPAQT